MRAIKSVHTGNTARLVTLAFQSGVCGHRRTLLWLLSIWTTIFLYCCCCCFSSIFQSAVIIDNACEISQYLIYSTTSLVSLSYLFINNFFFCSLLPSSLLCDINCIIVPFRKLAVSFRMEATHVDRWTIASEYDTMLTCICCIFAQIYSCEKREFVSDGCMNFHLKLHGWMNHSRCYYWAKLSWEICALAQQQLFIVLYCCFWWFLFVFVVAQVPALSFRTCKRDECSCHCHLLPNGAYYI